MRIYTHLDTCIQLDAYIHLFPLEERRPHPYAYACCRKFEIMRHVAHCNTLQHTATHCLSQVWNNASCRTLQHTATHCNTLQHTACRKFELMRHVAQFYICPSWLTKIGNDLYLDVFKDAAVPREPPWFVASCESTEYVRRRCIALLNIERCATQALLNWPVYRSNPTTAVD